MKDYLIYIFVGEDEKKVKQEIKILESNFPDEFESEFYFADDTPADEIIFNASTISLFGEKKVIKVYGFDKYIKEFSAYFENPNPTTKLILVSYKNPADVEKKLNKYLNGDICYQKYSKPKNPANSLISILEKNNVKISENGKRYIMNNFEKSGDINDYVELLSSLPQKKDGLEVEDLYHHLEGSTNIFVLLDFLFSKNLKNSLIEFHNLLKEGENLFGLLNMVHKRLGIIWKINSFFNNNYSISEIMKELSLPKWRLDRHVKESRLFSLSQIAFLLKQIQSLDVFMKSYDKKLHRVKFEKLIFDICR